MRSIALAALLHSCASQPRPNCGVVPISRDTIVTAGHCVDRSSYAELGADLAIVRLRLEPVPEGTRAECNGKEYTVRDAAFESDGRMFLRASPRLSVGDSGFGLWYEGELIGVAIGNDGREESVFLHASEIAKALARESLNAPAGWTAAE